MTPDTPKHPVSASLGEQQAKDRASARKDAQRLYSTSPAGRAAQARYHASPKGQGGRARHYAERVINSLEWWEARSSHYPDDTL